MPRTARTVRRIALGFCALKLRVLVLGLAAMPAPFLFSGLVSGLLPTPASAQTAPTTLPTNVDDYRCFVLIQDRQKAYLANTAIDEVERVQVVNNLIIIAAFFAGRMTHYSTDSAEQTFERVRGELAAMTPAQRTEQGNRCANFYLSVIELLGQLDPAQQ